MAVTHGRLVLDQTTQEKKMSAVRLFREDLVGFIQQRFLLGLQTLDDIKRWNYFFKIFPIFERPVQLQRLIFKIDALNDKMFGWNGDTNKFLGDIQIYIHLLLLKLNHEWKNLNENVSVSEIFFSTSQKWKLSKIKVNDFEKFGDKIWYKIQILWKKTCGYLFEIFPIFHTCFIVSLCLQTVSLFLFFYVRTYYKLIRPELINEKKVSEYK